MKRVGNLVHAFVHTEITKTRVHILYYQIIQCASQHRPPEETMLLIHSVQYSIREFVQDDTKKRELLKNPTKIEVIQEKKILTQIEPLQLAF